MTIEKHLRIAGGLQVAWGIVGLLVGFVAAVLAGMDLARLTSTPTGWDELWAGLWLPALMVSLLFCIAAFQIWFGRCVAKGRRWAVRIIGFVWCFLGLFSFPLGTAVNAYTLWVLVQVDKRETLGAG